VKTNFEPHIKNLDESLSNIDGALSRLYTVKPVAVANKNNDEVIDAMDCGDEFSNIFGGERKECKAKGLKGKAFRDCVQDLKIENAGASRTDKKAKRKEYKQNFNKALLEGKVEKGKVLRKVQKFNPAAIALRGTVLSALRFNIFGVATRLYPAYLTVEEAKAKNFDLENLPKAKEALQRVSAFYTRIGGDPNKMLKNVIVKAHDKPILKTKKAKARKAAEEKKGFDGSTENYSNVIAEETIVAISTASAGVLTSIIAAVGASKNPYKKGSKQAAKFDTAATDAPPPSAEYKKLVDNAIAAASADKAKGLPLDAGNVTGVDDKIWGMPKAVVYVGGALLVVGLIWGGYKLIKGKKVPVLTT